jgi:monoamine oxidase
MERVDSIVVGAGLAGLGAADALRRGGQRVVVLEAQDRVGGRLLSGETGGMVVNLGGQWVGPDHTDVLGLAAELGVTTTPTYDDGTTVLHLRGRRYEQRGTLPRLNPIAMADLVQGVARLYRHARRVPLAAPWDTPGAARLDGTTMATWIERSLHTRASRALVRELVWGQLAADPAEVSVLGVCYDLRSAGLLRGFSHAEDMWFDGGAQLLATGLAARLGDVVHLGSAVRRIDHGASGVRVHTDADCFAADSAVVCLPPTLCARLAFDPPLPAWRDRLVQRMPMGDVIKVALVYETPFWRQRGLSGAVVSDAGPITMTSDSSPEAGGKGVLVGFVFGPHARRLRATPPDQRTAALVTGLAPLLGDEACVPIGHLEKDWVDDPWARGAYSGHFVPDAMSIGGPGLDEPVGRIHWAGTDVSSELNGYMEGALRSGRRAADAVLGVATRAARPPG